MDRSKKCAPVVRRDVVTELKSSSEVYSDAHGYMEALQRTVAVSLKIASLRKQGGTHAEVDPAG